MGSGIVASDGAYYFKYKGKEICVMVLNHGPNKVLRYTQMQGKEPASFIASGSSIDKAVGKMISQLDVSA